MTRLWLLGVIALAATGLTQSTAHRGNAKKRFKEPSLPVVEMNACPFEGCTFGQWKVVEDSLVYSSWRHNRNVTGKLKAGERVVGLTGVHITRAPDRIAVKQAIPSLGLEAGDVILRYMYLGEGFANIWAIGKWHKGEDCTFVTEKNKWGCLRDCSAIVTRVGAKEWWVKVRLKDGRSGWVLSNGNFDGMDQFSKIPTAQDSNKS